MKSSVKNTLKLHESEPVYRNWLRKGLNRLVRENSSTQLKRIYIFDDTKMPNQIATEEYNSLIRNMQYYLDYFNYEITELKGIITNHLPKEPSQRTDWEKRLWKSLKKRVKIYITTKSTVEKNWDKIPKPTREIIEKLLEEFASDMDGLNSSPYENLVKLDFLFAEIADLRDKNKEGENKEACNVIYKFDNPRADPGELEFTASLMREEFDAQVEERKLFNFFTQADEDMSILLRQQRLRRAGILLDSIDEYRVSYGSVSGLKKFFEIADQKLGGENGIERRIRNWIQHSEQHGITCQTLKNELKGGQFREYCKTIIQVRHTIEKGLYNYFFTRAEYLFELLEKMSVEVQFFDPPGRRAQEIARERRTLNALQSRGFRKIFNGFSSVVLYPISTRLRRETRSNEKTVSINQIFPFVIVEDIQSAPGSNENPGVTLGEVIKKELDKIISEADKEDKRKRYFGTFEELDYPDSFLKI